MREADDGRGRPPDAGAGEGGEALPPGARLEEFEIEGELGAGGFGVTYLAHDLSLGRRVAVKEYFPLHWGARRSDGGVGPRSKAQSENYTWGLSRFLQEARVLAQPALRHPNLVQVYRIIEGNGTAYLVTEFVEGRSLQEALDADGPWREDRVRGLLSGLMDGLSAVHAAGLLHRDIKPANVMLRAPDETPVLIDFGAARYATGQKSGTLTDVLTPGYAPFEQYHSRGKQGAWTDVYALGAVAYRALSGEKPEEAPARLDGEDPLRPVAQAAAYPVSEGFASAVDGALSVRASDRPQSLAAWRKWLEGGGAPAPVRPAAGERPLFGGGVDAGPSSEEPDRRRWWYAAAAVAVVFVGLLLVFISGGEDAPSRATDDLGDLQTTVGRGTNEGGESDRNLSDSETGGGRVVPDGRESGGATDDSRTTQGPGPDDQPERMEPVIDRPQRREIQRALAAAGCDPGGADGVFGPATRQAIVCWQEDLGEEPTGRLDQRQVALLLPAGAPALPAGAPALPAGAPAIGEPAIIDDHADHWGGATAVRLGGRADGVLETAGDADWFSVSVREAGRLTLETTGPTDTLGLYVRLNEMRRGIPLDEAIPWYASDLNGGAGQNFRISTPVRPGDYGVRVEGGSAGELGRYRLVTQFDPDDGCSVNLGGLTQTPVTRQDDWDGCSTHMDLARRHYRYYRFALVDDASVGIDVTSSNADTELILLAGGGDYVEVFEGRPIEGRDEGPNASISTRLEAGEYAVVVSTDAAPRSFTLTATADGANGCTRTLGRLARSSRQVVSRGEWDGSCPSVHYDDGEYARYYAFALPESAAVRIDLTSPTVDTWLALRRGGGTGVGLLEEDDDEGEGVNARITRYLEAGEYTIEATTLGGGETGPFTLTVSAASATSADLANLDSVDVSVCTDFLFEGPGQTVIREGAWDGTCPSVHYDGGEYARYYSFTLTEPGRVTIDLTSPTVDTWLALRRWTGTDMRLLDEDDDGGADNTTNARITRHLEAGDYTVEATTLAGGQTGDFVLYVSFRR